MAPSERGFSGLQLDGKNVVEVKYFPPQEKDRQSHNQNGQYLAQADFAASRVGVPGEQGKYVERRKSKDPSNQYVVDVVRVTQVLIGMLKKKWHFGTTQGLERRRMVSQKLAHHLPRIGWYRGNQWIPRTARGEC
jgi:hypothetical protein